MSLSPGERLGAYAIVAPLGAGGMGEVWRATDTRLGRDVALKLLPAAFASDPDRLARFEREAKLLASLSHTHIAGLFAFEEAPLDGASGPMRFLAMELAEGEDLAARLQRGAIPVDEAIAIAKQIAEALEAAHEKGIVHRDLKPANVKVSAERPGQGPRLRPGEGLSRDERRRSGERRLCRSPPRSRARAPPRA